MLSQAFLEAVQAAFWPVYLLAMVAGALRFAVMRQWCIGRAVFALALGSLAQFAWEGSTDYLRWWQHLIIDVPVFVLITMPPRHYWQSTLGALVFAQLFLHCIWAVSPELGREHWLAVALIGFVKCAVILLWSGGARVELALSGVSQLASRMVPQALAGKLA